MGAHARVPGRLTSPTSARTAGGSGCGRPGASRTAGRWASAVHRLLAWEEQAILDLIESWGWVDRSHRKLAHRGSYTGTVFVSPSTLLRVALKHQVVLPGEPFRPRPVMPVFPEVPWEKNRIWIWDCSHFTRCQAGRVRDRRRRHQILDRLPAHRASRPTTQAQLLFARALEDQGLLGPDGLPPDRDPEDPPILVAWSDNGSEMTAIDTRQFMALMAIAQHHGRPGTPDRSGSHRIVLQPPERLLLTLRLLSLGCVKQSSVFRFDLDS